MSILQSLAVSACLVTGLAASITTPCDQTPTRPTLDLRSYNLGIIAAFAEVVGAGVKKLALSDALPPAEMSALLDDARRSAERYQVKMYLETDLLVTDLFPEDIAKGKQVLMLYQDPVLDQYRALKAEKARLVASGAYKGEARRTLARAFGRLLSYSESHLDKMLAGK